MRLFTKLMLIVASCAIASIAYSHDDHRGYERGGPSYYRHQERYDHHHHYHRAEPPRAYWKHKEAYRHHYEHQRNHHWDRDRDQDNRWGYIRR